MRVVLDVDIFTEGAPHQRALMRAGRRSTLACVAAAGIASVAMAAAGVGPGLTWGLVQLVACVVVLSLVALPVHELVHATLFQLLGPTHAKVTFGYQAGMLYAGCPGVRLSRARFCAVLLAPFTLITLAFVAFGVLAPLSWAPLAAVWLAALHTAGCVGDAYFVWLICRTPGATCVEDSERGIRLLGE